PAAEPAPTSAAAPDLAAAPAPTPSSPSPAPPSEPETPLHAMFDAALVAHNAWNTAPAYDYFSADNTLLAGGLTLGIDALELGAGSVVAVDLTATTGETESDGPLPHYVSR